MEVKKMPLDFMQRAKYIADIATGEFTEKKSKDKTEAPKTEKVKSSLTPKKK